MASEIKRVNLSLWCLFVLVAMLLCLTDSLLAQASYKVSPGDSLRLEFGPAKGKRFILKGRLMRASPDSLHVSYRGRIVKIPTRSIEKIYYSRTLKRNTSRGFLIGSIVGALTLGIVAGIQESLDEDTGTEFFDFTPSEAFVAGTLSGLLNGLVLGGIIGSFIVTPDWQEVAMDSL